MNDLVNRKEVLRTIEFEYKWLLDAKGNDPDINIAFDAMKSKIKNLPPDISPIIVTEKWISVDDKLPEHNGEYLTILQYSGLKQTIISKYANDLSEIDEYTFADNHRPGWYNCDADCGYYEQKYIIAWMPLPELCSR